MLAQGFLDDFREVSRSSATGFSEEAAKLLLAYDWPGNVRELQNTIQRAMVLCEGSMILPEHLPAAVRQRRAARTQTAEPAAAVGRVNSSLEEIERRAIEEAVLRCGGNVSEAIRALKMGRNRFYRRLKKYGLMDLVENVRKQDSR